MTDLTKLYLYQGSKREEALAVGMWHQMHQDGDMDRTFQSGITLTQLLQMFRPPNGMLYGIDDHGIWFSMWFELFMAGAVAGCWCRADKRHSRQLVATGMRAWGMLLTQFPCVFGVTKQEKLLKLHRIFGYTVLGKAPQLWDGKEDGWLLMLTREGHEAAIGRLGVGLTRWEMSHERLSRVDRPA